MNHEMGIHTMRCSGTPLQLIFIYTKSVGPKSHLQRKVYLDI